MVCNSVSDPALHNAMLLRWTDRDRACWRLQWWNLDPSSPALQEMKAALRVGTYADLNVFTTLLQNNVLGCAAAQTPSMPVASSHCMTQSFDCQHLRLTLRTSRTCQPARLQRLPPAGCGSGVSALLQVYQRAIQYGRGHRPAGRHHLEPVHRPRLQHRVPGLRLGHDVRRQPLLWPLPAQSRTFVKAKRCGSV